MKPNDGAICDHSRQACDDIPCPNGKRWMTKPRLAELRRLAREHRSTYGIATRRLQRTIVAAGYASFVDSRGRPVRDEDDAEYCAINEDGRRRLRMVAVAMVTGGDADHG